MRKSCPAWSLSSPGTSLTGAEINLANAQQVLKNFIDSQARKITIDAIQRAVAEQFGLRAAEIKTKSNSRAIVFPRQVAMFLAKSLTMRSLPEIGRRFGGRDHTTVLHAVRKIEALAANDTTLREEIDLLKRMLQE